MTTSYKDLNKGDPGGGIVTFYRESSQLEAGVRGLAARTELHRQTGRLGGSLLGGVGRNNLTDLSLF